MNRVEVDDLLYLAQPVPGQIPNLVKELNNKAVQQFLCGLPYPYQVSDAEGWIERVEKRKQDSGKLCGWQRTWNCWGRWADGHTPG